MSPCLSGRTWASCSRDRFVLFLGPKTSIYCLPVNADLMTAKRVHGAAKVPVWLPSNRYTLAWNCLAVWSCLSAPVKLLDDWHQTDHNLPNHHGFTPKYLHMQRSRTSNDLCFAPNLGVLNASKNWGPSNFLWFPTRNDQNSKLHHSWNPDRKRFWLGSKVQNLNACSQTLLPAVSQVLNDEGSNFQKTATFYQSCHDFIWFLLVR
jgi:hypothetical protein